jgi:hypothetical protein
MPPAKGPLQIGCRGSRIHISAKHLCNSLTTAYPRFPLVLEAGQMQVSCISQHREILERSLAELRSEVDRHQQCLLTLAAGEAVEAPRGCIRCDCPHRRGLRQVLLDAVGVLEATRKSFKSKQIEGLRKAFLRVLQEESQEPQPPL